MSVWESKAQNHSDGSTKLAGLNRRSYCPALVWGKTANAAHNLHPQSDSTYTTSTNSCTGSEAGKKV